MNSFAQSGKPVSIRGALIRKSHSLWHLNENLTIDTLEVEAVGSVGKEPAVLLTNGNIVIGDGVHQYYSRYEEAEWVRNEIRSGEIAYLSDTLTPEDEEAEVMKEIDVGVSNRQSLLIVSAILQAINF